MANKQKVTLSIDSDVYRAFQKHCDEHAIQLSKKVELWMKKAVENAGGPGEKDG